MNNLQKLGFTNWFSDKVDLSKTDFIIVRVIGVKKRQFILNCLFDNTWFIDYGTFGFGPVKTPSGLYSHTHA